MDRIATPGVLLRQGRDVRRVLRRQNDVNRSVLSQWCVLALVAGVLLGWVFARIGWDGWPGAVATAFAVGLVVADA